MTTQEVSVLFAQIANELNLSPEWRLVFDKSRRRFGACYFGFAKKISMSAPICALNGPAEVGKTIRHEIAHAFAGRAAGHGPVWQAWDKKCGGDGRRCYSSDVETPELPWVATCPGCKREIGRTRPPKAGRTFSCGKCGGGRFNPAFALAFAPRQTVFVTDDAEIPTLKRIIQLRGLGLGWVKIDAELGIFGKKGWHSWKIYNDAAKTAGKAAK